MNSTSTTESFFREAPESDRQYRNLLMQSPFAFAILKGKDMVVELANHAIREVWGKGNDIEGKPLLSLMPEIRDQGFPELLDKVFTTGEPFYGYELPVRLQRRGVWETVYFNFVYQPHRDIDNTINGIIITANEVTPQVLLHKQIGESEEQLKHLANAMPQIVWIAGPDGQVIYYNDRIEEFEGAHKMQDGRWTWEGLLHPDDKQSTIDTWKRAVEEGSVYEKEHRIKMKDGSWNWHLSRAFPERDERGAVVKWYGTATNVHAQKQTEEALRQSEVTFRQLAQNLEKLVSERTGELNTTNKKLVEAQHLAQLGTWEWDVDSNGLTWSDTLKEIYGIAANEQLSFEKFMSLVHPDDREYAESMINLSFQNKKYEEFYHRIITPAGIVKTLHARGEVIANHQGNITRMAGTAQDITGQVQLVDELQKAYESDKLKSDFIKMASHELKTPVTSIKGYVQLLLSMMKTEEDKQLSPLLIRSSLTTIDRQVTRLTRLMSELLDVSKIENGLLELTREEFSLNELVIDIVQDVLYTNQQYSINVFHDYECRVFADRDRIGQVLINLLNNAIKYSPNRDRVDVWIQQGEANTVLVKVVDYGIGIQKDDHHRIFERFYRVEGKEEKTYPGFGIGLFIAREILQRHEGSISVESEKGKGSVFSFMLPCK